MPNSDPPVDVAALLDRSGLGTGTYKTFSEADAPRSERRPAVRADEAPVSPAADERDLERVKTGVARADQRSRVTPTRPTPVMDTASRLLARAVEEDPTEPAAADWTTAPANHSLALSGVGGGSGVTTILANAAAALAARGERVVVAQQAPSLLPFYFGAQGFRSAPTSFAPPRGSEAGPVHLVTGSSADGGDAWLLAGLTEIGRDVDRLLLHAGRDLSVEARRWSCRTMAVALLLTPEPASLLRLATALEGLRRTAAEPVRPLMLLNRFEPSNDLHVEVRRQLSQRFGELLLPFVIESDDAFPRCLAAGGPVTELEPESRAAEGIETLVEWIRNYHIGPELD